MKINEIIVESRSQLDEGVMDAMKSKLSGLYQRLNQMPGFNKVIQQVKTHGGEINKIASALQAKSQGGQLTKQDVLATVIPLANTVSSEMGGGKVGQSDNSMIDSLVNTLISSLSGSKQSVQESKMALNEDTAFGIGIIVMLIIGICILSSNSPAATAKREEDEQFEKEYEESKKRYFAHLDLNGARTGQEKDDYDWLWNLYGRGRFPMSHVDRERYEKEYRSGSGHGISRRIPTPDPTVSSVPDSTWDPVRDRMSGPYTPEKAKMVAKAAVSNPTPWVPANPINKDKILSSNPTLNPKPKSQRMRRS